MKCHPSKKPRLVALFALVALCAGLFAFAAPALAGDHYYADEEMGEPLEVSLPGGDGAQTMDVVTTPIVALDPGHGSSDVGASYVNEKEGIELHEKDLNWTISMYTKEWLEQHGVRVFLTHSTKDESVYRQLDNSTQWGYTTPSIYQRAQRAINANACLFVSQHINETPSGTGFEIYVPYDCDYFPSTRTEGLKVAKSAEVKLASLGLYDRGIKTRVCDANPDYDYPNGSNGDYYGIIRYTRQAGMPSVLIEHAFIDNPDDAKLLGDDEFLKKLGYADAEAIYANLNSAFEAYRINQIDAETARGIDVAAEGSVFRLYNQWTGDHLSTLNKHEARVLISQGWTYEGVKWLNPSSGDSVWRIRNPYSGDHFYTKSKGEAENLVAQGWEWDNDGKPVLNSTTASATNAIAVYRLYNPFVEVGTHLFTTDASERDGLTPLGWEYEDVALYGIDPKSAPSSDPVDPSEDPSEDPTPSGTPIMGKSSTTKEALASRFESLMSRYGKTYPSIYAKKGAANPREFAEVLWDQAASEGVRPEVLLAQVIDETGWLQFGGMVDKEDCNFGGIGAEDNSNGEKVAKFPDVATGLLAQTQHLRAYADAHASRATLNNPCVDPRFDLVVPKGKAPTVEGLSGTWATSAGYGDAIVKIMNDYLLS